MSIAPTTMRAKERPVFVTRASQSVRSVVASWAGRSLRVQGTPDLLRAAAILEAHEADLYECSPHAPRLLASLRAELARPERQAAA